MDAFNIQGFDNKTRLLQITAKNDLGKENNIFEIINDLNNVR